MRFGLMLLLVVGSCWLLPEAVAGRTGLLKNDAYIQRIRKDHPRLFLNRDTLPVIRAYAKSHPELLENLRKRVEALPPDAPYIELPDMFRRDENGLVKPTRNPGEKVFKMVKYCGALEAIDCALYYTLTGDTAARDKAIAYLLLYPRVLEFSVKGQWWMDLTGNTRISAMFAYDLLYHDLTPAQRRELMLPLLAYIRDAQPGAKFTFRRTHGSHRDGNYGETALPYFLGITLYGDGIADEEAVEMLKAGARQFVRMMDFRDEISAGSGLLSALSYNYAFYNYPPSTHLFLHSWHAAFGEDISDRWNQMLLYHRFVEGMTFLPDENGNVYVYGIGDISHRSNQTTMASMYQHFSQNIHFYSKKHPEAAADMYAFMAENVPEKFRNTNRFTYPMLAFLSTGFDPARIQPGKSQHMPYFYNSRFGFLSMWSGRGRNDTYASFRFGGDQVNHQQYDDLSFVIFKHDFLALDAGSRTETDHHHNFGCQTVAHNSLLIHMPEEPMAPFWKSWSHKPDGKIWYNHGGQSIKTKGKAVALHSGDGFIYAAGDGTGNYAAAKCREAVRQFVFLKPDIFVIYDRVTTVKPDQKQEFLLHTTNEPQKIAANVWRADAGKGRIFMQQLLPRRAAIAKVGGPGREFWASGANWPLEPNIVFRYAGNWRLETAPAAPTAQVQFCHVIQAADTGTAKPFPAAVRAIGNEDVVTVNGWELRFRRTGEIGLKIRPPKRPYVVLENTIETNIKEK